MRTLTLKSHQHPPPLPPNKPVSTCHYHYGPVTWGKDLTPVLLLWLLSGHLQKTMVVTAPRPSPLYTLQPWPPQSLSLRVVSCCLVSIWARRAAGYRLQNPTDQPAMVKLDVGMFTTSWGIHHLYGATLRHFPPPPPPSFNFRFLFFVPILFFSTSLTTTTKKEGKKKRERNCGRPSSHNFGHPLDMKQTFVLRVAWDWYLPPLVWSVAYVHCKGLFVCHELSFKVDSSLNMKPTDKV